ncbi:MAG: hypothetical protein GX820_07195 [Bacteroidales bacterium]|nr:hypothetical protein [Bacteroidales bacterium]
MKYKPVLTFSREGTSEEPKFEPGGLETKGSFNHQKKTRRSFEIESSGKRQKKLASFSHIAQHQIQTAEVLTAGGKYLRIFAKSSERHFVREGNPENRADCSTVNAIKSFTCGYRA